MFHVWKLAFQMFHSPLTDTSPQYYNSTMVSFHIPSGIGKVNQAQIEDIASKPEYVLIRPSARDLEPLSAEVIQHACKGTCRQSTCYCISTF